MTFEPVDYGDDEYETAATRPRPRRPRSAFWRRFWRSLTGQRASAETCRPVTVSGDDGEPVHTTVFGAEPMSNEIMRTWNPSGGIRQSDEYHAAVSAARKYLAPPSPELPL